MITGKGGQELNNELSSNTQPNQNTMFAGFWRRVAALLIDQAIVNVAWLVIGLIIVFSGSEVLKTFTDWIFVVIFWLYFAIMESSTRQATVGKIILGIKVTDENGNRLSFLHATGRTFAKFLSVITLGVGFLMAGFTKKKQALHDKIAKCLVVKYRESHLWRAIAITAILFIISVGAMGAYIYYIKWPQWKQNFITTVKVASEPTKISDIESQAERTVSQPKEFVSFSEKQYDDLLSAPLVGLDGTNIGPAVLNLSTFWEGQGKPIIWIKVALMPLPNFNLGNKPKITIDQVLNKTGNDVYNRESNFEDNFFQYFTTQEQSTPVSHLSGIRNVKLIAGTNEKDIARIKGTLTLELPLNIQTISLTREELGQQKKVGNIVVTLTAIENSQVLWNYQGSGSNYMRLKAYNSAGQELEPWDVTNYPSQGAEYTNPVNLKGLFKGDIASVKIFIAQQIVERKYPFVLQK